MRPIFSKTIVAAWMASLLLSTAGLSIHRIYCFCKKEAAFSFVFQPEDSCQKPQNPTQKSGCQPQKSAPACCQKRANPSEKKQGCTEHSVKIVKLDAPFIQADFSFELPDFQPVMAAEPPIFFFENAVFLSEKTASVFNHSPPPRPAGRALRQLLKSYRC